MLQFPDTVRVARLAVPSRDCDGTEGVARPPHVGDTGTVVEVLGAGGPYLVECIDSAGYTLWLATFSADELEKVTAGPARDTKINEAAG